MPNETEPVLTQEQIDQYHAQGYLVIRGLIPADEALDMAKTYDALATGDDAGDKPTGGHSTDKLVQKPGPARQIEGWMERLYFTRVLAVGRQLHGDDIEFAYDQIIMKPPRYDAPTPWHQDAGYWQGNALAAERAITCWLALSEVTEKHGCMEFVPGSHKAGVREHYSVAETSEISGALETKVDEASVKCPMSPGDASFHHSRTLHHTTGNFADTPRRGLVTHLFPAAAKG